jgi:anionic cell wall polymer biosynthesis LytR-Cps2A-Psr (LCP) family protein
MENQPQQNKSQKVILTIIIILFLFSLGTLIYFKATDTSAEQQTLVDTSATAAKQQTLPENIEFSHGDTTYSDTAYADSILEAQLAADTSIELIHPDDSAVNATTASQLNDTGSLYIKPKNSKAGDIIYQIDKKAGSAKYSVKPGKRINIAITGMDGRIGRPSNHADANHIISILIETGEIDIISVPRDTYCDLGYDDTTNLNKLTICRSNKGRERYLKELAKIAKVGNIPYWVEFGFSQAMGIIDFLGYKNPQNTLQVLRSRKGLGGDDYQRSYTQGQFIRQAILSHFNKFTGSMGHLLIRAGLLLVETNLSAEQAISIVDKLETLRFPQSPASVTMHVRPPINIAYKVYDFTDDNINKITNKIERFNKQRFDDNIETPQPVVNVARRLNDILQKAAADTAKNPTRVISSLRPYFEQRAWYQVNNKTERNTIRDKFGILLGNAYTKKNKLQDAENVKAVVEADKAMFQ